MEDPEPVCLRCGDCCRRATLVVRGQIGFKEGGVIQWLALHKLYVIPDAGGWRIITRVPCEHLAEDGKCSIHDSLEYPEICCRYFCDKAREEGRKRVGDGK